MDYLDTIRTNFILDIKQNSKKLKNMLNMLNIKTNQKEVIKMNENNRQNSTINWAIRILAKPLLNPYN